MSAFALSEEQRAAATSPNEHLLLIAPPGCGKTEVLAHRAAHQLALMKPNQRVLALTFTKRARTNLEERLRSVLGQARARRQIVVRNFHGFATQIVLAHGRTIGLRMDDLELPKTTTVKRAVKEAGGDRDDQFVVDNLLNEIKRESMTDVEVLEAIESRYKGRHADLAMTVERERQEANQLHYGDLLRHAQRLLHIPKVAQLYQAHFGAVLVDEFQDLSPQQLELTMLSCSERRTFAGDPLQGIYTWAGASPAEVEAEVRRSCGDPVRLRESYRSSPRVLETVNSIGADVDPDAELVAALPEAWFEGGCSAAVVFQDQADEAAAIVRLAKTIHGSMPEASIGIIARAAWRRKSLDAAFAAQADVPVRRWELAIDDPATVALIQNAVATLPRGASVEDAHLAVIDALDPADVDAKELIDDAFKALEESDASTARQAIKAVRITDPKQAVGPGVHLLNAHTGKGQQFDWTFVVGLEEGHLPGKRNNQGDALKEEQRVLLVMFSRARHGLIVTRTRETDGWRGPKDVPESRWWPSIEARYSTEDEVQRYIAESLPVAGQGP